MKNKIKKPVIEFSQVTKSYSLQKQKTLKELAQALVLGESTKNEFTALSNINFKIFPGETVGVIGPNGSGKSTILKLIAHVTYPTKGKVFVHGRVSPLIELGAGMHPELTGTENISLNGSILGLSQKEIKNKYKDIVDFAELWEFIDQPIKHYSSGMYMRLGFAIAVHTNPDILLVDEILSVGDVKFQEKCFKKMEEFKKSDTTILYVSHSLKSIYSFCDKIISLKNGELIQVDENIPYEKTKNSI